MNNVVLNTNTARFALASDGTYRQLSWSGLAILGCIEASPTQCAAMGVTVESALADCHSAFVPVNVPGAVLVLAPWER
jgi:hypothetical protein